MTPNSNGFMVDPDALSGYVRATRHVADDLGALAKRELAGLRDLPADSLGRIGADTGFTSALDQFGTVLRRQVDAVGERADTLARAVSDTAGDYRDQEGDIASELLDLLRHK